MKMLLENEKYRSLSDAHIEVLLCFKFLDSKKLWDPMKNKKSNF